MNDNPVTPPWTEEDIPEDTSEILVIKIYIKEGEDIFRTATRRTLDAVRDMIFAQEDIESSRKTRMPFGMLTKEPSGEEDISEYGWWIKIQN